MEGCYNHCKDTTAAALTGAQSGWPVCGGTSGSSAAINNLMSPTCALCTSQVANHTITVYIQNGDGDVKDDLGVTNPTYDFGATSSCPTSATWSI